MARLTCAGSPPSLRWHEAASAAKHQGFAEEALVEHHRAIDVWNAALVGAILNPTMHAFEHPLRDAAGAVAMVEHSQAAQSTARQC